MIRSLHSLALASLRRIGEFQATVLRIRAAAAGIDPKKRPAQRLLDLSVEAVCANIACRQDLQTARWTAIRLKTAEFFAAVSSVTSAAPPELPMSAEHQPFSPAYQRLLAW
ncbi:MAG: hypothetical protein ACO3FE_08650, partial [Planctomycetaceae bacterium]